MSLRVRLRVPKQWDRFQVNIDEELQQEELSRTLTEREIDDFNRRNLHSVSELSDHLRLLVFGSDECVTCSEDICAAVEYIVGPQRRWNSSCDEVCEFRRAISRAYLNEWKAFQSVHPSVPERLATRSLPQVFSVPPLQKAQMDLLMQMCPRNAETGDGSISMRLWYLDSAGSRCSTRRRFPFDTAADDAIRLTMSSAREFASMREKTDDTPLIFVFRVKGRNEYIYGSQPLINYRYIRHCVSKRAEIDLVVEPKEATLFAVPLFRPSYPSRTLASPSDADASKSSTSEICLWDLTSKLSIRIVGGFEKLAISASRMKDENVRDSSSLYFAVLVEAYVGTWRCCEPQITGWQLCENAKNSHSLAARVYWKDGGTVTFSIDLSNVPRELKLCFTLVASSTDRIVGARAATAEEVIAAVEENTKKTDDQGHSVFFLGTAATQLFDYAAKMRMGMWRIYLWEGKTRANPIGLNSINPDSNACTFEVEFPCFDKPVFFPSGRPPKRKEEDARRNFADREAALSSYLINNEVEQLRQLKRVLMYDPLVHLSSDDKTILWKYREMLLGQPKAMAKVMSAVNWLMPFDVYEAHCLLRRWSPLAAFDALELLDAHYADLAVREQAVEYIDKMSDYELRGCILQLVQVLKYEPYHYSALARFLLRRSLRSNHIIGHYVFWYLAAEVKNLTICERHGLLLEELIKRSPHRLDYVRQVYVCNELLKCALRVQRAPKKDRVKCLRASLAKVRFPHRFTLALNPSVECCAVDIDECKVMESKKFPLWLAFRNHLDQDEHFFIIFKSGDDLRQDLLTLQLLEFMDSLWKASGLDLHLIPYGCISTGEGVGMIEVVLNSDTIANITRREGGAQAAFNVDPIINWLRQFNHDRGEAERCLWNFVLSVAGYTVATYVLGIGDRHNDNIMLRQDGTLFHIDFGHFLGNFKTKFGIKRETAPFIFTPMYLYAMGGPSSPIFKYFVDVACRAYNALRRHSSALMMLFMLMLSTGIPELQTLEDIEWLRTVLLLNRTDEEASEHYKGLINDALGNFRTLLNDYIHIMVH
ncbi:PI3-kinase family, ras-binding domain/Phosphoinositide 3-kinase C2/Phosphoinositide 3-kinase family, accessory domain (PIK domain)/Phosphatidylinositol 3- and 4-kinase, putative [Leishmania donovani]|uniref:phosphatidylinositol 3-kinase n=1 Tax=Leishmania donovani TaxID=5661 RepID=A0A3S7WSQ8_LEIDO|nr:PI3-kinase family, ras-binding domain/Phosphoinositide 3-kinase C2/Phosphoinositide 3-kinase family, accessory domain (PIK domain)/Phosphatidylinositol 3- and 4-kinase, putative [Leishmania donovani]